MKERLQGNKNYEVTITFRTKEDVDGPSLDAPIMNALLETGLVENIDIKPYEEELTGTAAIYKDKHVYILVEEDVDVTIEDIERRYERYIDDESMDSDMRELYKKELEILRATDKKEIYEYIRYKMEIPFMEYISCAIDSVISYNMEK